MQGITCRRKEQHVCMLCLPLIKSLLFNHGGCTLMILPNPAYLALRSPISKHHRGLRDHSLKTSQWWLSLNFYFRGHKLYLHHGTLPVAPWYACPHHAQIANIQIVPNYQHILVPIAETSAPSLLWDWRQTPSSSGPGNSEKLTISMTQWLR